MTPNHVQTMVMAGAMLGILAAGCSKPTLGTQGEPAQEEGAPLTVTVTEVKLERIELEGPDGPLIFAKPALAVRVKFENTGEASVPYQPSHTLDKVQSSNVPVLYVDPGYPEKPIDSSAVAVPAVYLDGLLMPGQQEALVQIAAGSSLEDLFLFQPPQEETLPLLLAVPSSVHGGKQPLYIKINYEQTDVAPPPVVGKGEAAKLANAEVTVTSAGIQYVEMVDTSREEKGFSKSPVLQINYTIKNTGDKPLTYSPNHNASGNDVAGMALHEKGGKGVYMRVRFGADREVVGQMTVDTTIAPGKEAKDFVLFERPPENIKELLFLMPGKTVGSSGLARVGIPYTYSNPDKPAELQKKDKE
ncbi:MAG: DUF4352 domain-containing protein [Myxococcota bacterium]